MGEIKIISPVLKRPCSRASRGIMGEMRDKPQCLTLKKVDS